MVYNHAVAIGYIATTREFRDGSWAHPWSTLFFFPLPDLLVTSFSVFVHVPLVVPAFQRDIGTRFSVQARVVTFSQPTNQNNVSSDTKNAPNLW